MATTTNANAAPTGGARPSQPQLLPPPRQMGATSGAAAAAELLPPLPADVAAAGLVNPRANSPARAPEAASALSPDGAAVSTNASKYPPAIVPVSTPPIVVRSSTLPSPSDPQPPWSRAALDLSPERRLETSRAAIESRKSGVGANSAAATATDSPREQNQATSRPRKERRERGSRPPKPLPQPPQQQQRDTARGGLQSPTAAPEVGYGDDDDGWVAQVVTAPPAPTAAAKKPKPFLLSEWRARSPPPHSGQAHAVAGTSASAASSSGSTSPVTSSSSSSSPTPPLTLSSAPVSPVPPTPPMLSPVSTSGGGGNGSSNGGSSGGGVGAGIIQLLRDRRWQRTSREPAPVNPEPPQAAVDRRTPPPPPPLSASQPLSAEPYSQHQPPPLALAPPQRDPALRHHRSMDFKEALRDNLGRLFPGATARGGNGNGNGNGHGDDVAPSDARRRSALFAASPSPPPQLLPPDQGHLPAVPWPSQHSPAAAAFYTSDTAAVAADFAASPPPSWAPMASGAPDPPAAEFMASLGVLKPHVFGVAVVDAVR
ncbi:hypothetical protein HK405_002777, partial [Cladochytrium tenue]